MPLIATLIANPAEPCLDDAALIRAQGATPGAGAGDWLAPRVAVDMPLPEGITQEEALGALRAALAHLPADIVVQPAQNRRKRLFLADMDSTMIGQECIDELADFAGLKAHVSAITERAMRGEIEFAPALRERVALLKGLPLSVVDEVIATRIRLTPGGTHLVRTMRANGAYTCLVSGGFTLFTSRVAAMVGFDEDRANVLLTQGAAFSGAVQEPILGKEAKLATLLDLRAQHGLAQHETMAVGDGANDLAMIGEAGIGIAFHAKPAVAAAAHARIDHGDLTALLYMQGYRQSDFAGA